MTTPKLARPQIRNIGIGDLRNYRLPLPGIVSILHRVSGAGLFLTLPVLIWLFDQSLSSETSFQTFLAVVEHPLGKLVLLGLSWAFLHHACAGVRFLLLDLHLGTDKAVARRSSVWVFVASLTLTALVALTLLGVWS
jgi:succinate dehydrogenase / fumarate reductase cytochrome b subunit